MQGLIQLCVYIGTSAENLVARDSRVDGPALMCAERESQIRLSLAVQHAPDDR
jgi:hypothetical protein